MIRGASQRSGSWPSCAARSRAAGGSTRRSNNDLAHLAANILIVLASVWQADLISGESLKSLKSEGRGRSVKGRWANWRKNSQIRGALWRTLRYKCHLSGLHLVWQHPAGTTHTCPKCGKSAHTYSFPCPGCARRGDGSLVALCCLWLERGQGLCRRHQYRTLRRGLSQALAVTFTHPHEMIVRPWHRKVSTRSRTSAPGWRVPRRRQRPLGAA